MASVTALWPLERKPPIPMVNQTGCLTLLFWLERRADLHGSTRDQALTRLGCPTGTPRSLLALEWKPEIPTSTSDEDLGPGSDCRGIQRGPS